MSAFGTLMVLALNIFICITVTNVCGTTAEAKEFKADVIAEIENSNFNPNVINGCMEQAKEAGYELQIISCLDDENRNIQTAQVILTYSYQMPLFGIFETKTTRGIAR